MCTIGYCKDLKVLFKNRDKDASLASPEEIVADSSVLACRTAGADYYCWGMNHNGCSFVSSAINTPDWGKLIYQGKMAEAQEQYIMENEGLINPMKIVSRMLADMKRAEQCVEVLTSSKHLFKGYNCVVADADTCYHIQLYKDQRVVRELTKNEVIANHFFDIQHGPKVVEDYPSTFRRFDYANTKIDTISSVSDVAKMLRPVHNEEDKKQIWRTGTFKTISSSILCFDEGRAFYSKGIDEEYTTIAMHRPEGLFKVADEEGMHHFEMSRYIDLNLYHEVESSHPFYKEMTDKISEEIRKRCESGKTYRILELGAGTGLFTEQLLKIPNLYVTALELDLGCCEIMRKYLENESNLNVVHGNALEYSEDKPFDFVVSTFAHDHIHWDYAEQFSANIQRNLTAEGLYFMGGEILPDYESVDEREKALYKYHGMIVDRALKNKDYRLAQIEINALESGVEMIGDFKRSANKFEAEMNTSGFSQEMKEKMGPLDQDDVGGVFVYAFKK